MYLVCGPLGAEINSSNGSNGYDGTNSVNVSNIRRLEVWEHTL